MNSRPTKFTSVIGAQRLDGLWAATLLSALIAALFHGNRRILVWVGRMSVRGIILQSLPQALRGRNGRVAS